MVRKILQALFWVFHFILFDVQYKEIENARGYFIVKRVWVWFMLLPIFLPCFMLYRAIAAIFDYVAYVFSFYHKWMQGDGTEELTFKKKFQIRMWLEL